MEIAELYKIFLQHPSVQTDTRKLKHGDIFFALSGPNFDGNSFAADALEKGAAFAVIDNPKFATNDKCIVVNNVLATLQQLARFHRRQFDIPVIAITGSNGKTTTKELTAAVLKKKFNAYATEGNLNNHIGVPLTLLRMKHDCEICIVEMGANHLHEIESYCSVAEPTYGIITNCGKAHLEGFGSEENIKIGKGELFRFLEARNGNVFRNTDLPYLEPMTHGINRQITYGSADADYIGQVSGNGLFLNLTVQHNGLSEEIKTQLVGTYNFPNVMCAIAAGLHFGVPISAIVAAIYDYQPDNSRSQYLEKGGNRIILDAYNANPSSMREAILNFAALNAANKILWIGGMKEMGAEADQEHFALTQLIAQYDWQGVILVGNEFKEIHGKYQWFADVTHAREAIRQHMPTNSYILIKGSRGSKMEVMLEVFEA
jgi:UDP-N-acetylmuramoyl-tripeptide--D-alanyl-D-alanine ligase